MGDMKFGGKEVCGIFKCDSSRVEERGAGTEGESVWARKRQYRRRKAGSAIALLKD